MTTTEMECDSVQQCDESTAPEFRDGPREHLLTQLLREGFVHQIASLEDSLEATASAATDDFRTILETRLSSLEERLLAAIAQRPVSADATPAAPSATGPEPERTPAADDPLAELRLAFLSDDEPETQESAGTGAAAAPVTVETPATTITANTVVPPAETEPLPFEVPDCVDPHQLEESELRKVFLEREALLKMVAEYARRKSQQPQLMTLDDLKALAASLPEQLAARVEHTLARLNQQQRLGELELSLERARVARQVAQLQATRELLESNARKLGLTIGANGAIEGCVTDDEVQTRKKRRWLSALGFGH
ncbi:MAG: hypothetical protein R3C19_00670 [Planctomycetaceae bacterium]